ncbi:MAG: hypothetical protein JMM78_03495 [Candidatus Xiphinematobacter sp.]|nr:MAG: hypothetical protein JMM78_03495 [Candidatus Xiphinematobacter sp.]
MIAQASLGTEFSLFMHPPVEKKVKATPLHAACVFNPFEEEVALNQVK